MNSLVKEKWAGSWQDVLFDTLRKVAYLWKGNTLERMAWCLVAIGFCWTEVEDYHQFIFLKQMWIMIGIGVFYCLKKGALQRKKLFFTVPVVGLAAAWVWYFHHIHYFYGYYFFNTAIPILISVSILLYILVVYDCFAERRPLCVGSGGVLVLVFAISVFLSVNEKHYYFLAAVVAMLPYAFLLEKKESQRAFFKGITDGLCIGVCVVQWHAWKHRPYNAFEVRYAGATSLCIYAARIYLMGFAAWLAKYVECARQYVEKWKSRQGIKRLCAIPSWLIAAFILAIVYMTGNRGTVVAMVLMAMIALVIRFLGGLKFSLKNVLDWMGGLGRVAIHLAYFGGISLAFFPIAFQLTRWLPAHFNEPDYLDSCGNRYLSWVTQEKGEPFWRDNEYRPDAVKINDDPNSIKYISYYECLCFNIGRLVPGMNVFLYEKLGDDIWNTRANRIEYFYNLGFYTEEDYNWYWKELTEQFEEQYVGGSVFSGEEGLEIPFKDVFYEIISAFLLYLDAEDSPVDSVSDGVATVKKAYPGDTPEEPWSTRDALQNDLGERGAIYFYTLRHLNLEGHEEDAFKFYQTEDVVQPHAHNIFLQAGFDYGICAMIVMILMFLSAILIGIGNIHEDKLEYVCSVLLALGFAVFGMFDVGFETGNGITAVLLLMIMCIRGRESAC